MTDLTNKFTQKFPALTANTSPDKLKHLVGMMKEKSYLKGDIIIQEGLIQDNLFFVMDGTLNVFIVENGQRLDIGDVKPGNIIGEVSVFAIQYIVQDLHKLLIA